MLQTRPRMSDEYNRVIDQMVDDLKERIKQKGLTQAEFSALSGINVKVLNRILTKKTSTYTLSTIIQIYHNLDARFEIKSSSY